MKWRTARCGGYHRWVVIFEHSSHLVLVTTDATVPNRRRSWASPQNRRLNASSKAPSVS